MFLEKLAFLDAALKYNLIQKTGSWYSLGDNKLGQGRESVIEYLNKEVELANDLDKRLRKIIFNNFDQEDINFIKLKED